MLKKIKKIKRVFNKRLKFFGSLLVFACVLLGSFYLDLSRAYAGVGRNAGRIWSSGVENQTVTAGVEFTTITGTPTVNTTTVRSGAASLRTNPTAATQNVEYNFASANVADAFFFRGYIYVASAPAAQTKVMVIRDSTPSEQVSIRMNTDRTLELWNEEDGAQVGSDSSAIPLNTWVRLELGVNATTIATTTVEAKIDGTTFANGTVNHANGIQRFQVGVITTATTADFYWDDFGINQDNSSFLDNWVGEGKIIHLRPNGNGTNTAWTGDYTAVDEITPNDGTDTIVCSASQNEDYTLTDATTNGVSSTDTIRLIHMGARVYNGASATSHNYTLSAINGGTVDGTGAVPTIAIATNNTSYSTNDDTAPANYQYTSYDLPGTTTVSPWTPSLVDSMQVRVGTTDCSPVTTISTVWALVEYTSTPEGQNTGGRLFTSGAELQSTTANMEFTAVTGATIDTSVKRSGAASILTDAASESVEFDFEAANVADDYYLRAYIYVNSAPGGQTILLSGYDSGNTHQASIRMNTDRTLELWNEEDGAQVGIDSEPIPFNTWTRLELKVDATTIGSTALEARVDGVAFASGTVNHANGIMTIRFGNQSAVTGSFNWDDIAVNKGTGSFQNGYPGDGNIAHLNPSANGAIAAWTLSPSTCNASSVAFQCVDEVTPNDATDILTSSTANQQAEFDLTDTGSLGIPSEAPVSLVSTGVRLGNSATTASALQVYLRDVLNRAATGASEIGKNTSAYQTNGLSAPFLYPLTLYDRPHSTSAWTTTDLNSARIGTRLSIDGGTNTLNVSALWLATEYVAPTVTATSVGSQITNVSKNTTANHIGTFVFTTDAAIADITNITITESGTIDGQNNIDNIKLRYELDSTAPYDCASASYGGAETQFGSTDTDGFSGADGTASFSGSLSFGSTGAACVFVEMDVTSGAAGGQTIELSIPQASDFTLGTGLGIFNKKGTPSIPGTTTVRNHTTLGNNAGVEVGDSTIAPGAGVVDINNFTLVTDNSTDTITALTVTLAPANSFENISKLEITNSGNVDQCTDVDNPSSVSVNFTGCSLPVTTSLSEFKVRVTPKTHANMPAVPGASYGVTATVTSITGTNSSQTLGDSGSGTITIDNLSPNSATSTSGTAGTGAVTLNWTASNSADIAHSVVLRWAASTPGAEVPVEGSSYTAGNTIGSATVACVLSSTTSQAHSSIVDGTGGTAGCTTSALTDGQAYSYEVFSRDSRGNYDAGVVFTGSPFTPVAALTISGTSSGLSDATVVRVAIGGSLNANSGTISSNAWTITPSPSPTTGQSIIVFADGVADNLEAVAISKYDGSGNVTTMSLVPGILSIGSGDNQPISLSDIDDYTCSSDEDVMHSLSANVLNLQGCSNSYSDETLSILGSNTLTVATTETITTEKINNAGTITASGSPTFNIDGNSGTLFTNSGTFTQATSTVNLRGNGDATINSGSPTFYNLTSSGTGTKTLGAGITLAADGSLSVTNGTFDPASYLVSSAGISNTSVSNGATLLVNAAAFSDNYEVDAIAQGTRTTLGTAYVARNIATDSEHVFVGENFSPGRLKRIYKNNFTARDVLTFNSGYNGVPSLWQNATDLFVGNYTSPGRTIRVNKSTFTQADQVTFTTGENQIFGITGDASYVYSGTDTSPGKIMRSAIGNLASYTTKTLNSGDNKILSLINDDTYIYGTLYTSPGGKIFRLNKSDFSTYTTKTFASGEDNAHFITQDDTYLYVGLDTSPAKVARVNKSDFSTTTVLTLPSGYDRALSITNDQDYVYVGLYIASTGRVVKISKSDFATYSTIDLSGSHSTYGVAIDGGYLYTASNGVTQVDRYAVEPIGTTFTFNTGSTVSYAANGAQTIRADLGYANLKIDTAGTKTLGGNTTATGTVTVNAGTLDTDSVNNRSLQAQRITIETGATLLANASAITLTGTSGTLFSNSGTFTAGTSTVTLSGNGDATINSGSPTFNHLVSSGTGTKTLGANISVNGNLTVQGGGIFDPSTYTVSMIGGTVSNTDSTIRIGGVLASNSFSGVGGVSRSGTTYVEYSRSGDQTVSNSSAYRFGDNLTISGSGIKTMGGSASFNATHLQSGTLALNNTTLTLTGTGTGVLSGNGALDGGTGTVKFTGDGAVTIPAKGYYHLDLSPTITDNRTYTLNATTVTGNLSINPTAASALALTTNMGANLTVTGTTTIQRTTSATATLDTDTGTDRDLTTGYLSIQAGGTLDAGGSASMIDLTGTSGTLFTVNGGTFTPGNSSLVLSGNGNAVINSGIDTFNGITISGTGIKTASSALTLGSLNISNASGALSMAGYDLTVSGSVTNAGTFSTGTAWEYSRPVTIDYTKVVNTTQTDFPVLISGTYDGTGGEPDLRSIANGGKIRNASGHDIAFYADAALTTPLAFEQETWNATTGAIDYWVKIPSLSHTTNTTIYLAYGNPSVTVFQGDSQGTWSNGYEKVFHFKDSLELDLFDSTSERTLALNNGVNTATVLSGGKIGVGVDLNETASRRLNITPSYAMPSSGTVSLWWQPKAASTQVVGDYMILRARTLSGEVKLFDIYYTAAGNMYGGWYNNGDEDRAIWATGGISNGNWYYLTLTWTNGSVTTLYSDAISRATTPTLTATWNTLLDGVYLNNDPNNGAYSKNYTDEVRISNVARSTDWIATEYNNQNDPSTFYSIGSETTLGGVDPVVTLSGTGTVWNNSGTVSAGTSTFKLTNTSASEKTFVGGGATYNNLWLAGGNGGGDYVITGNNTFNDFKTDGSAAHTISFDAGSTQTLRTFTVAGTAGNEVTLTSTTSTPFTLIKTGSADVESDYLAIQYSTVSPYGAWTAGTHSTDMGSNSGWIFNTPGGSRGGGSGGNAGGESSGGGQGNTGGEGTCSDGIQNGNETGVDSGGRCTVGGGGGTEGGGGGDGNTGGEGTCSDGIQNGNETGVDTGGRCTTGGGGGDVGFNLERRFLASTYDGVSKYSFSLSSFFQKFFRFL